ncbi:hypothetical protein K432DRAFT_387504 [Lepidopterella palustris CBS 459.81]|uniref:Uncharacterized protein n=1 Tax=Lepidopterella palustris CBS 459.81 TaxID=1314670 RepID=A0A8E2DWV1_9PEZI|nr:hypothetical protein K432DRAFT_387504 [Lepidopterella palustris CBS 459.81]
MASHFTVTKRAGWAAVFLLILGSCMGGLPNETCDSYTALQSPGEFIAVPIISHFRLQRESSPLTETERTADLTFCPRFICSIRKVDPSANLTRTSKMLGLMGARQSRLISKEKNSSIPIALIVLPRLAGRCSPTYIRHLNPQHLSYILAVLLAKVCWTAPPTLSKLVLVLKPSLIFFSLGWTERSFPSAAGLKIYFSLPHSLFASSPFLLNLIASSITLATAASSRLLLSILPYTRYYSYHSYLTASLRPTKTSQ